MSTGYPKVHVVGSGAYYSYRPITRFIEKVERNHYRDNSSRPKQFENYGSALNSRGDGYTRTPSLVSDYARGASLPPDRKRASSAIDEDLFFSRGDEELLPRRAADDILSRHRGGDDSFFRRDDESVSRRKGKYSSYLKQQQQQEKDSTIIESDRKALFGTAGGEDSLTRLRRKHPFRLDVENEKVAPHESSIWPSNRPHFDLVSSYDTMVDYLGIRDKSKK